MSQAYKCDRCKNFFEGPVEDLVTIRQGHVNQDFDLCSSCMTLTLYYLEQNAPNEQDRILTLKTEAEKCSSVINAIKRVRELSGMHLKEAKDFVEANCAEWVKSRPR